MVPEVSVVIPIVGLKLGPELLEVGAVPAAVVLEFPIINGATEMVGDDGGDDEDDSEDNDDEDTKVTDSKPCDDCSEVLFCVVLASGKVVGSGGKVVVCTEIKLDSEELSDAEELSAAVLLSGRIVGSGGKVVVRTET